MAPMSSHFPEVMVRRSAPTGLHQWHAVHTGFGGAGSRAPARTRDCTVTLRGAQVVGALRLPNAEWAAFAGRAAAASLRMRVRDDTAPWHCLPTKAPAGAEGRVLAGFVQPPMAA